MKVQLLISFTFFVCYGVSGQAYDYLCVNRHGDYLAHPSVCSKFIRCSHGRAYEFQCPGNLLWHQKLKTCDYQYRTKCEFENSAKPELITEKNPSIILKLLAKENFVSPDKIPMLTTAAYMPKLLTEGFLELSTAKHRIPTDKISELSREKIMASEVNISEKLRDENTFIDNTAVISTEKNFKPEGSTPELSTERNVVQADNTPEVSTEDKTVTADNTQELSLENKTITVDNMSKLSTEEQTVTIDNAPVIPTRENLTLTDNIPELAENSTTLPTIENTTNILEISKAESSGNIPELSTKKSVFATGSIPEFLKVKNTVLASQILELSTIADVTPTGTISELSTKEISVIKNNIEEISSDENTLSADQVSKILTGNIQELSAEENTVIIGNTPELSTIENTLFAGNISEILVVESTITVKSTPELSPAENTITAEPNTVKLLPSENIVTAERIPNISAKENDVSEEISIELLNAENAITPRPVSNTSAEEFSTERETVTESTTLTDNVNFTADNILELSTEAVTVDMMPESITLSDTVNFTTDREDIFTDLSTDLNDLMEQIVAVNLTRQILDNVTADSNSLLSTEADIKKLYIVSDTVNLTEQHRHSFSDKLSNQPLDNITAYNVSDAITTGIAKKPSINLNTINFTEEYKPSTTDNLRNQSLDATTAKLSTEAFNVAIGVVLNLSTEADISNFSGIYTVNSTDIVLLNDVTAELSSVADTVNLTAQLKDTLTEKTFTESSTEAETINLTDQELSPEAKPPTNNITAEKLAVANISGSLADEGIVLKLEADLTNLNGQLTDNSIAVNLPVAKISEEIISSKETPQTTISPISALKSENIFEIVEVVIGTTITPTTSLSFITKNSFSEDYKHTTSYGETLLKLHGKNIEHLQKDKENSRLTGTITTSTSMPSNREPLATTTSDPRLPFRAIECQGENNRRQFKAMDCYQYYQCFAGWAFLLNCHEGWRFDDDMAGCIQDVDKECGY